MAFEGLTQKLNNALSKLTARGKLTEQMVKDGVREVRVALLEADVNYLVVKDFCKRISERAVGSAVMESLTPGQQVIKIVSEEMTALMGAETARLTWSSSVPTIYMLCGLQGSGKTTMAAKLAKYLVKTGKKPCLAACDIYRPAAIRQLQVVGEQAGVPVFEKGTQDPVKTALQAVEYCRDYGRDVLIIDTAGRLHIDDELMDELKRIKQKVKPQECLFVVDSMTGQDAVNVCKTFDEKLGIDGVILTKLDGDTRGGAALSIKAVVGKPIKFSGIGEKLTDIEPFHPDRMAQRILGMGDVMTLIEKAAEIADTGTLSRAAKRRPSDMTLDDFLDQMRQMKKMGGMESLLSMIPGGAKLKNAEFDEASLKKPEAIICSMTKKERRNPSLLNASRRKRIAAGSGTTVQDVNALMNRFEQARTMMKRMMKSKGGMRDLMRNMR